MERTLLVFGLILLAVAATPKLARLLDRSAAGRGILWAYAYVLAGALFLGLLITVALGWHFALQF